MAKNKTELDRQRDIVVANSLRPGRIVGPAKGSPAARWEAERLERERLKKVQQ